MKRNFLFRQIVRTVKLVYRMVRLLWLFLMLPLREKLWVPEILVFLAAARFMILFLPFRFAGKFLGEKNGQLIPYCKGKTPSRLVEIGKMIEKVVKISPVGGVCLDKAVVARMMLGWRRYPMITYFGADSHCRQTKGHAWVQCGSDIITGETGKEKFTVVASFSFQPCKN
ncbi:MAG: lasso peptide biosynthesis B2 protein [Candidatus Riflebacteria bacterium]|nr:lasso peptide biosynthesis B2 protein [Candidatus Riflebacteria bacterium]